MKSCCKLCGEENCGFVSRNLEYKCDKYNLYCAAVDKVCEWIEEHKNDYAFPIYQGEELTDESYVSDGIIKDLRKAMEE